MNTSTWVWRLLSLLIAASTGVAGTWSRPTGHSWPTSSRSGCTRAAPSPGTAVSPGHVGATGFSAGGRWTAAQSAAKVAPGLGRLLAASLDIAPPTLVWNVFLGASSDDQISSVVTDRQGNAYLAGTFCHDRQLGTPVRPFAGKCDILVAKLAPNGELVWHTFLGGAGFERGLAIARDAAGNLYIAGVAYDSWGNPRRPFTPSNVGDPDAVIAKLGPDGNLIWLTFLGSEESDSATAVLPDARGSVYVLGGSRGPWGSPLRPHTEARDGFVAKLDANGNLVWNTFLGGRDVDWATGLALAPDGDLYVAGLGTQPWWSNPLQSSPNAQGGGPYLARLSPDGALRWAHAAGQGVPYVLAIDRQGDLYLTGQSWESWGNPLRPHSGDSDIFVARLSPNAELRWNTFLGSPASDEAAALALTAQQQIILVGTSAATWGTPRREFSGTAERDAVVVALNADGELAWHTFLGSSDWDGGLGVATRVDGTVLVAGQSSRDWGAPRRPIQGIDGFVALLDNTGDLLWNTFLGTYAPDMVSGVALDEWGDAYVAGASDAYWEATPRKLACSLTGEPNVAVARLDYEGRTYWTSCLGGPDADVAYGIATRPDGRSGVVGMSGSSWGTPVRPHAGEADAFVAGLSPQGELLWNTFLGGPGADEARGVAMDGQGVMYVVGKSAAGWGEPMQPFRGQEAAFVARVEPNGELAWHTFLGEGGQHLARAVALDSAGNIYVAGSSTQTWGTPRRPFGGGGDGYVACLGPEGNLRWHTFLGGSGLDAALGLAVAPAGGLYVVGTSGATWGQPLWPHAGDLDAFAVHLDAQGNVVWSTFLGGDGQDTANAVAVDARGNLYVVGTTSATWGDPARSFAGTSDAFVAILAPTGQLAAHLFLGSPDFDAGYAVAAGPDGQLWVGGESARSWGEPIDRLGDWDAFVALLTVAQPPSEMPTPSSPATTSPTPGATATPRPAPSATPSSTQTATALAPTPAPTLPSDGTPSPAGPLARQLFVPLAMR